MSQPTPYVPSTSFIPFTNIGYVPGQQLDIEFNDLHTTLSQTLANLALIQRDDGAVANGSIDWPQLSATLQVALQSQGFTAPSSTTLQVGNFPWVQANSYAAGSAGAAILAVQGSTGTPKTTATATAIFQSVNNVLLDSGQTVYVSLTKRGTAAIDHRAIFSEAVDKGGGAGSSISAGRFSAALLQGTSGNATGVTSVAVTTQAYNYLVGAEHQLFQNSGSDATTSYTAAKFATTALLSNLGSGTADAAAMTNPNSPGTGGKGFMTGYLVATNTLGAGNDTVVDTAFRNDASIVYGMDLSRGTYSGAPIVAPFATPASAAAAGKAGSICWDTGFIYVCTATNTWKRVAIATW